MKIIILLSFFLFSCASMQSGKFILLQEGDSLEEIAISYGTKPQAILNANQGKEFRVGNWFFIPQVAGIKRAFQNHLDYNDLLYGEELYTGKFLWPVPSVLKISSFYGKRWGRKHEGIDIPGKKGASILAADDGVVIYSNNGLSGYGNLTIIQHNDGISTVYAHAKKNLTRKGQKVFRGQVIALLGNSGRSTGPHLHFEVRKNDFPIDPVPFLKKSRQVFLAYKPKE